MSENKSNEAGDRFGSERERERFKAAIVLIRTSNNSLAGFVAARVGSEVARVCFNLDKTWPLFPLSAERFIAPRHAR